MAQPKTLKMAAKTAQIICGVAIADAIPTPTASAKPFAAALADMK